MSVISFSVTAPNQPNPLAAAGKGKRRKLRELANLCMGLAGGSTRGRLTFGSFGTAQASQTLTLSSAAGAVGATINGVTVTATASGGDTNTAALIAAAINASTNPLVQGLVTATSSGAVVTVRSAVSGTAGNQTTFAASGTGVTAGGTRLAGGTSQTFNL